MRQHLAALVLVLAGCGADIGGNGSNGGNVMGTCALPGVDSRCGMSCGTDNDCGSSLFCEGGQCVAQCVADGTGCDSGVACGAHGRCDGSGGGGGGGGGGDDGGGEMCPRVDVNLAPVIPTVLLLLDQSGSMTATDFPMGGMNVARWTAMKTALTDPSTGVLPMLQTKVKFGATLYTGVQGPPLQCPKLTPVAAAMSNGAAISMLLNNNAPLNDTPTGESISAVVSQLQAQTPGPDLTTAGPTVIVLATDGDPDTCALPNSNGTQAAKDVAVSAAQAAYTAGYPIFVLAVNGQGDAPSAAHMQAMANAGAGKAINGTQGNATYYPASSAAALVSAFNTIIKGVRSCQLKLSGMVDSVGAGSGDVRLNGQTLPFNGADGWKLLDPSTIELEGAACTTFKDTDNVTLSASFACGSVIL